MKRHAGFSLLELMLALAISSGFILAVYQLFFHQQQQFVEDKNLIIAQENARLATHLLIQNIQAAGDGGCVSVKNMDFYNNVTELSLDLKIKNGHAIYGFYGDAGGWSPALPSTLSGKVAPATDVIWVEKASYQRAHLAQDMEVETAVPINTPDLFSPDEVLLITDCEKGDLFVVETVHNHADGQILYPKKLSRTYGRAAQVMRWQVDVFYLAQQNDLQLALYQKTLLPDSPAFALVFPLENFKVQFGLLQQQKPLFLNANAITDWQFVQGLAIQIDTPYPAVHLNIALYNQ